MLYREENGNNLCPSDFKCFDTFYDVVADFVVGKKVEKVSCEEFENQGTIDEITQNMVDDKTVKLCPVLMYVFDELKKYGF